MAKFIFSTTGTESVVKFEELGAYFFHPTSAYTLSDYFSLFEISEANTIQTAIDSGAIIATDEDGNLITNISYIFSPNGNIPVFEIDTVSSTKTYIGYGIESACKIQEITTSGLTYTAYWASGNESFDKVWSARTLYSYF